MTLKAKEINSFFPYFEVLRSTAKYREIIEKIHKYSGKNNIIEFCEWCLKNEKIVNKYTRAKYLLTACKWIINNQEKVEEIINKYKNVRFPEIMNLPHKWVIIILQHFGFLEITENGLRERIIHRVYVKAYRKNPNIKVKNKFDQLLEYLSQNNDKVSNHLRRIIQGELYFEEFKILLKEGVLEISYGCILEKLFRVLKKFGFVELERRSLGRVRVHLIDKEEFKKLFRNLNP